MPSDEHARRTLREEDKVEWWRPDREYRKWRDVGVVRPFAFLFAITSIGYGPLINRDIRKRRDDNDE